MKLDMTHRVGEETPRFPVLHDSLECGEVLDIIGDRYVRCAAPATMLVYHAKDRRTYPMCEACGEHNVNNRGGVQVASIEE